MELTLSSIPETEALRYLGVRGPVPADLLEQVREGCRQLLPHCRVRYTWRLTHKDALGEILTGEDLPTLLRHCDRAVVMAVRAVSKGRPMATRFFSSCKRFVEEPARVSLSFKVALPFFISMG